MVIYLRAVTTERRREGGRGGGVLLSRHKEVSEGPVIRREKDRRSDG